MIATRVRMAALTVAAAAGLAVLAGGASAAQASTGTNISIRQYYDGCIGGFSCLFYRVNVDSEFNGGEFGFDHYAANLGQWQFEACSQGGTSCPGLLTYVRNEASSMATTICKDATVWYSPNYTGDFNYVLGYDWGNFTDPGLRNEEAFTATGNLC